MKHIRIVSRASSIFDGLGGGSYSIAETVILALVTVFFNSWDNFSNVISNLQKFYRKT